MNHSDLPHWNSDHRRKIMGSWSPINISLNNKWSTAGRKPITVPTKTHKNRSMILLILLLAGDIEQNPGPRGKTTKHISMWVM